VTPSTTTTTTTTATTATATTDPTVTTSRGSAMDAVHVLLHDGEGDDGR
jgi:hypothetical protein